jgi:integrase
VLAAERSKTGAKQISLSDAALAEFKLLHASAGTAGTAGREDHVFPALRGGVGPTVYVQSSWEKVRRVAELPDVRVHDLRHTFASIAVVDDTSLFLVGKALGHTQARTTERYAHLSGTPIRQVANRVSAQIAGSFSRASQKD